MDTNYDVFACVTDFCENFTPTVADEPQLSLDVVKGESGNESDEVESLFLRKKKRAGTRNKTKPGRLKASDSSRMNNSVAETFPDNTITGGTGDPIDDQLRANKDGNSKRRSQRLNKQGQNGDVCSNDMPVVAPSRRRKKQPNNSDVLEFMQRQTAAVLAQETAPMPSHNQRGRARRRYMANVASNATVIGVVDLAGPKTPPLPPRNSFGKKVINLDSDDECSFTSPNGTFNGSFDVGNEELSVKVKWADKIDFIPHRRHQKFHDMMVDFAKKNDVEPSDILLNLDDKIIEADDTPDSINYTITKFISARIVRNGDYPPIVKRKDPTMIKLKIQLDGSKQPLVVRIKKDQHFKILLIKCSEELSIPCERIKLSFDGDPLVLNETPEDLEFEGGEVIDCCIVK